MNCVELFGTIPVRGRKLIRRPRTISKTCAIPVRGRKRWKFTLRPLVYCTIPVRGRKLISSIVRYLFLLYHPRKGAKTCGLVSYVPAFQYHPRKGTKNSASKKMRSFSFANLNSLFSVGCPSMNGTIAAAVIFSLLRLLHGDKTCYNKANSKHLLQNQQIHFPFIVQLFHNP